MFRKILNNKKILLFIIFSILSLFSIVWLVSISSNKNPKPSPTPSIAFEFIKAVPVSGTINVFPPTTAIEFDFSKPIDVNTIVITSDPKENILFETDQNDTILFVRSSNGWKTATPYTITLNVISSSKEALPQKIIYNFEVNIPKSSLLDEVPR